MVGTPPPLILTLIALFAATCVFAEANAADDSSWQPGSRKLFIYPGQGQSPQQQLTDLDDCHYWAVNQTGFDPNFAQGNEGVDIRLDYQRAISACLEARGYIVR